MTQFIYISRDRNIRFYRSTPEILRSHPIPSFHFSFTVPLRDNLNILFDLCNNVRYSFILSSTQLYKEKDQILKYQD